MKERLKEMERKKERIKKKRKKEVNGIIKRKNYKHD